MDWRNLQGFIDVSPFMLFESTGDSEQDSDINSSTFDADNMEVSYDEADDAQSCCSDSSEIYGDYNKDCDFDHFREKSYSKKTDEERGDDYNPEYRLQNGYDEDEDDDDDGTIDQEYSSRKMGFVFSRTQKKCKVCIDSKMEPIKKEEKDKLFWDTCLAS